MRFDLVSRQFPAVGQPKENPKKIRLRLAGDCQFIFVWREKPSLVKEKSAIGTCAPMTRIRSLFPERGLFSFRAQ